MIRSHSQPIARSPPAVPAGNDRSYELVASLSDQKSPLVAIASVPHQDRPLFQSEIVACAFRSYDTVSSPRSTVRPFWPDRAERYSALTFCGAHSAPGSLAVRTSIAVDRCSWFGGSVGVRRVCSARLPAPRHVRRGVGEGDLCRPPGRWGRSGLNLWGVCERRGLLGWDAAGDGWVVGRRHVPVH
jgi:hypothetical protein